MSACYLSDKDPIHLVSLEARIEKDDLSTDVRSLLLAILVVPEKNKTDESMKNCQGTC